MFKLSKAEDLPIVDKFRIGRLIKEIDAQLGIYGKSLVELAKKYGDLQKIDGRDSYKIRPENLPKYEAEKAILDTETCDLAANRLPASSYTLPSITAADLLLLEPFIVMPTEDEVPLKDILLRQKSEAKK